MLCARRLHTLSRHAALVWNALTPSVLNSHRERMGLIEKLNPRIG
jgi:uncharacterized membrane protein YhaH (DUF805 family)